MIPDEVIELITRELEAGNIVEVKKEHGRYVVVRITRKVQLKTE